MIQQQAPYTATQTQQLPQKHQQHTAFLLQSYSTASSAFIQVMGIARDCCKFKTKMISRNALNPIWEENFDIEVHLPELAFIR